MSQMNAGIILAGQTPDFLGTIGRANEFAARANERQQQNALADLYQQHGAGIASGDQNALNALAGIDPMAALGVQQKRLGMDATRQGMRINEEELALRKQDAARKAEAWAAGLSQQEAAVRRDRIKTGLMSAGQAFQSGNLGEVNRILTSVGEQPLQSLDQFPYVAAQYEGVLDALEGANKFGQPEVYKPQSAPGKVYADIQAGALPAGTELRSPQVVVNTGDSIDQRPLTDKPPKGFQRRYDEEKRTWVDEPIPGSDPDAERAASDRKAEISMADYSRKFDIVNGNIDKAIASLDENGRFVAGVGSFLSGLPETEARNFQATIDTIKANLGFEELQNMRDSSPTGGALGQVTEREIAFLQAIQGNLDTAQSPEQLREILLEIKTRRQEFQAERERILSGSSPETQQPAPRYDPQTPDFSQMSDEELQAYIERGGK